MWEAIYASSHGNLAVRRLFNYALATIVAAFLLIIAIVPTAYAAEASWNGASISYGGESYVGPATEKTVDDLGLATGTSAYTYVEPPVSTTPSTSPTDTRHIRIIYFEPDVDVSVATSAKYKTYVYQGPSDFTNPSGVEDIVISPQAASTSGTSSCSDQGSLGWIICPVTNWLASGMDWVFSTLSGFLTVRPAESSQDSVLYHAWSMMRSIANIAFVIAFLIIIYSQLTTLGINNYSIKKLLPRLIVSAVLVNISFYICSIAIDLSNILGYSFQDLFITLRNSLVGTSGNSWDLMSWESISGFILSGGTVAVAGSIAAVTTLSTFGIAGSIFLLLPSLLVGLMAVLTALIVMAARQAVITILVIIAPLAFVAYLLPNTEKWFDKWQSTFVTLLVLFPAFSLIFGGSQLAASAIIQNADSINLVILGMLVQVAPLLITPMLMKLSGSLVGKIAGIVNNPNKGIIDRTRNWNKDRAENIKARRLDPNTTKKYSVLKRNAQRLDHNRRKREATRSLHTGRTDARWANSTDFKKIDQGVRKAADTKALGETESEVAYIKSKVSDNKIQELDIKLRNAKADTANAGQAADIQYEQLKSSDSKLNVVPHRLKILGDEALKHSRETGVLAQQLRNAQTVQQEEFAKALRNNEPMQIRAGGINPQGAESALAAAISAVKEAERKAVAEAATVIEHYNLDASKRQDFALGKLSTITGTDDEGNIRIFNSEQKYTRDAVIDTQMTIGTVNEVEQLIALSGTELRDYRKTIGDALAKNSGLRAQALHISGQTIDDIKKGVMIPDDYEGERQEGQIDLNYVTKRVIEKGKMSEKDFANMDADAAKRFTTVIKQMIIDGDSPEEVALFSQSARDAFVGDERSNIKGATRKRLLDIARANDPGFDPDQHTDPR